MAEHRAVIEPVGNGCRAVRPCGWLGRERRADSELAIHDAEQHDRYEADRARLATTAPEAVTGGADGG
jgi:hypothetical protein